MNYRHAFHAGNFADLLKHAVLTELMAALTADPAPLTVIDTHAGAGLYDLGGELARKTGEAARGIAVLMADKASPAVFARLKRAVRQANSGAEVRLYPGSPMMIADALRRRDRYIACEIRSDDNALLREAMAGRPGVSVTNADGWSTAAARTPKPPARALVLIDPPFERPDDAAYIVRTVGTVLAINRRAVIAIWMPIKDLASFDAALGGIEDALGGAPLMVAQARLRPLNDPMRMNGCAMAVINPPRGLSGAASEIASWIVSALGEAGAAASVTALKR